LVQDLLGWVAGLNCFPDCRSLLLANLVAAAKAVGGGKPLAAAVGLSPSSVGFWLRRRQTPTLSSMLRLSLVFGVPLEAWFSTAMGAERFVQIAPVPASLLWLSDRAPAVPKPIVETALRRALESSTEPPTSLLALAAAIPASDSHLHHHFPDLASRIVARHRAYLSRRKAAYAAELTKLVADAIADRRALCLSITAHGVLTHLGARWPLSRRRLQAVFAATMKSLPA
jgi:transcriptional regulator with XRE-family HTH domain